MRNKIESIIAKLIIIASIVYFITMVTMAEGDKLWWNIGAVVLIVLLIVIAYLHRKKKKEDIPN